LNFQQLSPPPKKKIRRKTEQHNSTSLGLGEGQVVQYQKKTAPVQESTVLRQKGEWGKVKRDK
jgi:hypothetical protein